MHLVLGFAEVGLSSVWAASPNYSPFFWWVLTRRDFPTITVCCLDGQCVQRTRPPWLWWLPVMACRGQRGPPASQPCACSVQLMVDLGGGPHHVLSRSVVPPWVCDCAARKLHEARTVGSWHCPSLLVGSRLPHLRRLPATWDVPVRQGVQ